MSAKILVVDGDGETVNQLDSSLTRNGNILIKAKTGKEALEVARREQPDLIVMEVNLPELDGYSVCKTLRAEGFKSPILDK